MIDLPLLERRGCSQERLQKLFTPDCQPDPADFDEKEEGRAKITKEDIDRCFKLQKRIRSRVVEGQTRNLGDWRVYHALDIAYDTPFRQLSPTLLGSMIDDKELFDANSEELKKITALGLERFITNEVDKTGRETGKKLLNASPFITVVPPLVKAYVTIRRANITNSRRLLPFFKYEPAKTTTLSKARCEALTDRVQVMSTQYGYFQVMDQAVLRMLLYGTQLQFVEEEWHSERQVFTKKATQEDVDKSVRGEDGEIVKVGDEFEYEKVVKEGLRYKLPHPTRTFRDLAHWPCTFNTDTGCAFAGYWEIARYGDMLGKGYWNTAKIKMGAKNIVGDNSAFFNTVYASCKMEIPTGTAAAAEASVGTTKNDSERQLSNDFYGSVQEDKGVMVTKYVEKLIPSENGLGNYSEPVWFRFVLAGDGCTILYAAPLPHCPVTYYGYDSDEARDKNSSMGLEIIPFQDQFGMLLTQIVSSAKQNLANLTLANTEILDEAEIQRIANKGETLFRGINIFSKPFKKLSKMLNKKLEQDDVFQSWTLPKSNTAELINVLKTILDVCERILQISNVEIAQQASHEQSAEEVRNLAVAGSSRVQFTASFVDSARDAQKRQLYAYLMAYGDEEFYAHIPADPPLTPEQLKKLGFTADPDDGYVQGQDKFRRVKVNKTDLEIPLHEFASTRDGEDRNSETKSAAVMAQVLQPLVNNPAILHALGEPQVIDLANKIAHMAGVDRDFIMRAVNKSLTKDEQAKQQQDQLAQLLKLVDQKTAQDIAPLLKQFKENEAVLGLLIQAAKIPPELVQQAIQAADTPQNAPTQTDNTPAE